MSIGLATLLWTARTCSTQPHSSQCTCVPLCCHTHTHTAHVLQSTNQPLQLTASPWPTLKKNSNLLRSHPESLPAAPAACSPWQHIYAINCLAALAPCLATCPATASLADRISAALEGRLQALVAVEAGSLLARSGLAEVLERLALYKQQQVRRFGGMG